MSYLQISQVSGLPTWMLNRNHSTHKKNRFDNRHCQCFIRAQIESSSWYFMWKCWKWGVSGTVSALMSYGGSCLQSTFWTVPLKHYISQQAISRWAWRSQRVPGSLHWVAERTRIERNQSTSRDVFFHEDEQEHPRYFLRTSNTAPNLMESIPGNLQHFYRTNHAAGDSEKCRLEQLPQLWYEAEVPRTLDISKPALPYTCKTAPPAVFKHLSCSPHNMRIIRLSTGAAWEQKAGGKGDYFIINIRLLFLWNIRFIQQRNCFIVKRNLVRGTLWKKMLTLPLKELNIYSEKN